SAAQRQAAASLTAAALLEPALACGLRDRDRRLGPLRGRALARGALARAGRVGRRDRDPRLARLAARGRAALPPRVGRCRARDLGPRPARRLAGAERYDASLRRAR